MQTFKVTIECTDEQAFLMEQCLDICARISMGQISELYRIFELNGFKEYWVSDEMEWVSGYKLGDYLSKIIKPIVFPNMAQNASYGVGNKECLTAQKLYEMVKKLQNYRASRDNHSEYSVLHNEPLHYSDQPLIKVY